MEVLDAARMREADRVTIEELRTPGLVLMENAGLRAAEAIADEAPEVETSAILVLCGRGNNGGDGFVVARHLARLGAAPHVVLVGGTLEDLRGDARTMADAWVHGGGGFDEASDEAGWDDLEVLLGDVDIVVDALFGTGLSRPLEGLPARVVEDVNRFDSYVVSIDMPSGVLADASVPVGPAIEADLTVTFARPKPAHLLPPAEALSGDLVLVDIGIPDWAVERTAPDLHWVVAEDVAVLLPEREEDAHKGVFGHVLVVGGSVGKAGAPALTGAAALTSGAGLVTLAAPSSVRAEVASFAPELMSAALATSKAGGLGKGAAAAALELAAERDVLAVGPGLGQAAPTPAEVRDLVRRAEVPVVLDADGLNAFAGRSRPTLAKRKAEELVLTPHPGEAGRLYGVGAAEIQSDRLGWARRIARDAGAVCVLKGFRTIVADPEGRAFIHSTGNPGLASGGTGDVLTGIIAAFLAQGLEALDAVLVAVHLHGLAAEVAVEETATEATLTASSLIASLADAERRLAAVEVTDREE